MVSLSSVTKRFLVPFQVIEGGSGVIRGVVSETTQQSQPSFIFVPERRVLRTLYPIAARPSMVVRAPAGGVYILGENGPSEHEEGVLWQSFRMFQATGQYTWSRETQITDSITTLQRSGPPEDLGLIWAAIEPLDRMVPDLEQRVSFEQVRIIAGANLLRGDMVDNRTITRVDRELGLTVGVIT